MSAVHMIVWGVLKVDDSMVGPEESPADGYMVFIHKNLEIVTLVEEQLKGYHMQLRPAPWTGEGGVNGRDRSRYMRAWRLFRDRDSVYKGGYEACCLVASRWIDADNSAYPDRFATPYPLQPPSNPER